MKVVEMRVLMLLFLAQSQLYNKHNSVYSKAIVGRNVRIAHENEIRFLVCILANNSDDINMSRDLICSGALISLNDVLTAEHCMYDIPYVGFRLMVGSANLLKGQAYYPTWYLSFTQWSAQLNKTIKYYENDIALIRLNKIVPDEIPYASISNLKASQLYGHSAVIAGWGFLNDNSLPTTAHMADVNILSMTDCESRIRGILQYYISVDKILICTAAEPFAYLKGGDSGGPLLYNNEIIGINKGVCPLTKSYAPNSVNAHFRIKHYVPFILYTQFFL